MDGFWKFILIVTGIGTLVLVALSLPWWLVGIFMVLPIIGTHLISNDCIEADGGPTFLGMFLYIVAVLIFIVSIIVKIIQQIF